MMNFKKILREELDGDFDWAKEITSDYWDYFDSVEFNTPITFKDFNDFIDNALFSKEVKNWQDWDESSERRVTWNYLNYLIESKGSACVTFTKQKELIVSDKNYIQWDVVADKIKNPRIVKYVDIVKKLDESVDDFDWARESRLTLQDIFDSAKKGESSFEVGDEFTLMGNLAGSAEFSPVKWTKPFKITIQSVGPTLEDSKFKIAVKEKEAVYNMEITLDPEKWPDGHVFKDIQFVPDDGSLLVMSQKVAFPEEEWIIEDSKEDELDWIKDVEPRLPLKIGTCLTFKQYEEEEDWVEDEYGNMVDHGKMDWHIIGEFIDEYNDDKPTFKMVATDRMGEGRELWMEVEKVKELYDRGVYQPCKKQTYLKRIMEEEINDFDWTKDKSNLFIENDILVFDLPVSREELYDYIIMALKSKKVNDEFTKIWMESLEKDGVNAREISQMIKNQEDGRVPYLHIQFGSELYYGSFEGNIIQSVKNRAAGLGSSYVFYSQLIGNEGGLSDDKQISESNFKTSDNELRDIAKKYKTKGEWKNSDYNTYQQALGRGKDFYHDITSHMVPGKKGRDVKILSDDELRGIAKKFNSPSEWKKKSQSTWKRAKNRDKEIPGFFEDITSHMDVLRKSLSDDELRDIAKKYETRTEWSRKKPNSYRQALRRDKKIPGFFEDITSHMKRLEVSEKYIYAYEFYDGEKPIAAYIGLTCDMRRRSKEHETGFCRYGKSESTVTKFIKNNPKLQYKIVELETKPLKGKEAKAKEKYWEEIYRKDGWETLNVVKTGALGMTHIYTNDELRDIAKKYKTKSEWKYEDRNTYRAALNRGKDFYDDITSHMVSGKVRDVHGKYVTKKK